MNKWLLLVLTVISVEFAFASEGALKVASPATALILANHQMVTGKPASPRDSKKTNSPRCNNLKNIVAGQVLPHKLLVRTESELKAETTSKYPDLLKLSKSSSGSSLPSPLRPEEDELNENVTQAPPIIGRRNTISS